MRYRQVLLPALPALLAVACAVGSGTAPPFQALPSATAGTPPATATANAEPSPAVEGAPAPPPPSASASQLTGIARSDAFWSLLVLDGIPLERYSSLPELDAAADLVVVSRVSDVKGGRSSCEPDGTDCLHFVDVEMQIVEVLAGSPPDGPLVLEYAIGSFQALEAVIAESLSHLPEERALFFLRDLDEEARSLDLPADLIRSVEGKLPVVRPPGRHPRR